MLVVLTLGSHCWVTGRAAVEVVFDHSRSMGLVVVEAVGPDPMAAGSP